MDKNQKNDEDILIIEGVKLYKLRALRKMLKVSNATLSSYIQKGQLKARQIGRWYYVSEHNLKKFLNQDAHKKSKKDLFDFDNEIEGI